MSNLTITKKPLKIFRVWVPTKFGMGTFILKAQNFLDAYQRLGKKYKNKNGWIEDDENNSITFLEIINLKLSL